ncbi:MAG TPA: hypothetical protein PK826_01840 [Anaerolineae bacterium]|nr:hypothetical protein [Anaerolineae bacterium]
MMLEPISDTPRRRRPFVMVLLSAVALGALLAVLQSRASRDSVGGPLLTEGPAAGGQAQVSTDAVAVAAPPEVAFDADECIHGPGMVPAGLTKITLTNMGKQEIHQIQLVELEDGRTYDDVTDALQSPDELDPSWISYAGGPNAVVPGRSASAFVDLKPGRYVVICTIANSLGKPHYTEGMAMELTVTDSGVTAVAAPPADLEVSGQEFAFGDMGLAEGLPAGPRVVSFVNKGTQPHEAALIRLDAGATAADYYAAVAAAGDTPMPGQRVGGMGAIIPGQAQSFIADLQPGRYALICFVIDPAARVAHAAMGMTTEFQVN